MKIATTLGWLAVSGMFMYDWAKSSGSATTTVIEVAKHIKKKSKKCCFYSADSKAVQSPLVSNMGT